MLNDIQMSNAEISVMKLHENPEVIEEINHREIMQLYVKYLIVFGILSVIFMLA